MEEFSDDGFDDLNANALQELENNAIQSTQAPKRFDPSQEEPQRDDYDFEDDDLDDAVVHDELRGKTVLPPEKPPADAVLRIVPQQGPGQDAWGPAAIPAGHFRPQNIGLTSRPPVQPPPGARPSQAPRYSQMRPPPSVPSRYQASQAPRLPATSNHEFAALQARIRELESRLSTKDGEIQIVRNRLQRQAQDYDREVQTLRKQTAEQLAKQERAVEAAKAAERIATTELEFTKRDLKEEVDRAKRKEKDGGTPKKNAPSKTWGVSDGFEDIEMAASPSKRGRGRSTAAVAAVVAEPSTRVTRTPTKNKRKRPAVDSPIMALETTEDVIMFDENRPPSDAVVQPVAVSPPIRPVCYDYVKLVLNHRSARGRPLAVDVLAGFALPSSPTESLAAMLLQKLSVRGDPDDPLRLPIEFCDDVIMLWEKCQSEGCLAPIMELVSLVSFTLRLNTIDIAPYIAQSLSSVAQRSCYEVGMPRINNTAPGDPTDESFLNFKANIATSEVISVVYLAALGCATSAPIRGAVTTPILDFWGTVHVNFVSMLLHHNQPPEDCVALLRLLCTSVFDDSIGPIADASRSPETIASTIIERVTYNLVETQRVYPDRETERSLRLEVLRTLAAFARSSFGMTQMALHNYLIPRLVIFLSSCIEEMYDGDTTSPVYKLPASPSQITESGPETAAQVQDPDQLQTLIAHTVLLLHAIVTDKRNKDTLNISSKLALFTGGSQKYLLSLARLNFAEEGVSEETAELAHELLEMAVTEEQGEELGEIFGS